MLVITRPSEFTLTSLLPAGGKERNSADFNLKVEKSPSNSEKFIPTFPQDEAILMIFFIRASRLIFSNPVTQFFSFFYFDGLSCQWSLFCLITSSHIQGYSKLSHSFTRKIEKTWGQIDDGPSKYISNKEDLRSIEMSNHFLDIQLNFFQIALFTRIFTIIPNLPSHLASQLDN